MRTGPIAAAVTALACAATAGVLLATNAGSVEAPQVQVPQVQTPQLPGVQAPDVQPPSLQAPQLQAPQVQVPAANDPAGAVPRADDMRYGCGPINDALQSLVWKGTIADVQAQAIWDGVKSRLPAGFRHGDRAAMAKALDETLADLVSKGTITQAQADAVKEAVSSAAANRPAFFRGRGFRNSGDV
jgi:hypothetical protein